MCWIERQNRLQPQEEVRQQHAREAEEQEAASVARPVLILIRIVGCLVRDGVHQVEPDIVR